MNMELLDRGRQVLRQQPFSVLLEAELTVFEPGRAELRLPIRHELKQQHGFVDGGAVSYLADNALTYAGEKLCATAQGTIAPLGAPSPSET